MIATEIYKLKLFLKLKPFIAFFQIILLFIFYFIFKILELYNSNNQFSVVISGSEVANNINFFGKMFANSYTFNFKRNKYFLNEYNNSFNNKLSHIFFGPYFLAKLSFQSKVFFYTWWDGFMIDRKYDYIFLNIFKIKIITYFCGDDIRSNYLTYEYYRLNNIDHYINYYYALSPTFSSKLYDDWKKSIAKLADKYSTVIFNNNLDQISYLKKITFLPNYSFDLKDTIINNNKFKNIETIKIIHAPTSPIMKGTPLVRAAIKKLELEGYDFEYEEIFGKTNEYVKQALANSHIVLNQFYSYVPGLLGIEGMAYKNCVLMSADYDKEYFGDAIYGKDCWVVTGYWEVYDKLKWLLDNPELIEGYAERGRAFVERHYTIEKAREKFYKIFRENGIEI